MGGTEPDPGITLISHGPYEELPEIASRRPKWADFAAWWDTSTSGRADDAMTNLAAACNVRPGPAELAPLLDEWGFLAIELAGEILEHVGAPPEGLAGKYPCVRVVDARATHSKVVMLTSALEATPPHQYDRKKLALDRARAELLPIEILDRAEAVSRRALLFNTPAGLLAFRPPPASVAGPYQDAQVAIRAGKPDASAAEAARALVLGCAIEPPASVLSSMIDEQPALVYCLYDELAAAGRPGKAKARLSTAP